MQTGKSTYKNQGSFVSNSLNTCISIAKVMLRSRFGVKLPKAEEKSCIVLGNGPSLATSLKEHPEFFKKHAVICVNSFSLSEAYSQLQPKYYVLLDPGFWKAEHEVIINTLKAIREKTSWKMQLLIPQEARGAVVYAEMIKQNPNIGLSYFNYTVFKGFEGISHVFFKNNLAMPQSQNVLVASVFLGINLGFKEIYLVGADHSWHEHLYVNEQNVVCVKQIHFYENEESVKYVPFYKGAGIPETFRMDEIFTAWAKVFYGYLALNKYAERRSVSIYNASEISFIDAFKRIRI